MENINKSFSIPFSITLPTTPSYSNMSSSQEVKEAEQTEQEENSSALLPPMDESHINEVEKILDYKFCDRGLVEEAMTHGSFYFPSKPKKTYRRLEFIGDAVLNNCVATAVFTNYPDLQPGSMTRLRAANVDTEKLARIAVTHGLDRYLRHKAPRLESQINDFVKNMKNYPIHSNGLLDPPKILADNIESLLGAVYVDTNLRSETVWKIFIRLSQPFITMETLEMHPVTELHELCRKLHRDLKFNNNWAQNHTIDVLIDGKVIGCATYCPKKEICHNRAAKVALDQLKKSLRNNELEPAPMANN